MPERCSFTIRESQVKFAYSTLFINKIMLEKLLLETKDHHMNHKIL